MKHLQELKDILLREHVLFKEDWDDGCITVYLIGLLWFQDLQSLEIGLEPDERILDLARFEDMNIEDDKEIWVTTSINGVKLETMANFANLELLRNESGKLVLVFQEES